MRLKELRGQVVVIAFWASWCVPCRSDLAFLKERYAKCHEDGLEIVGICLDEKDLAARRYVQKHWIPGLQVAGAVGTLGRRQSAHMPHLSDKSLLAGTSFAPSQHISM